MGMIFFKFDPSESLTRNFQTVLLISLIVVVRLGWLAFISSMTFVFEVIFFQQTISSDFGTEKCHLEYVTIQSAIHGAL